MFSIFFFISVYLFSIYVPVFLYLFFFSNSKRSLNTLYIFTCICVKDDYFYNVYMYMYILINLSFYLFIRIPQLFFFNSYTNFNILHMFIHVLSIIFIKNIYLSWVFFFFLQLDVVAFEIQKLLTVSPNLLFRLNIIKSAANILIHLTPFHLCR